MNAKSPTTLLSLPLEVREKIYIHALLADVNYNVLTGFEKHFMSSTPSQPKRNTAGRLQRPVLPMMLTCKTIKGELDNLMVDPLAKTSIEQQDLRTCILDINVQDGYLGSITWRQLPCSPSQTQRLVANIHQEHEPSVWSGFWGDGGPKRKVSESFQTLNLFLHCGPDFDPSAPLQVPIHLQELVLAVYAKEVKEEQSDEMVAYMKGKFSGEIWSLCTTLSGPWPLGGFVNTIRMRDVRSGEEKEMQVGLESGLTGMPDLWQGYGFEWGMERFQQQSGER